MSVDDGTHISTSVQSSDRTAALVDVSRLQGSDLPTTSVPGGSRSVLAASPMRASPIRASTPVSKIHPVLQALHDIEKIIGNKKHLYIYRLIEGYNVPGDSLFEAWKVLYNDWEAISESIRLQSFSSKSNVSENINPIINSILKYPAVQRNKKSTKKKLDLPKHMSGKEALEILKLQEEEKRRVELVKENNRQKRINQQAENKDAGKNVKAKKSVGTKRNPSRTIKKRRFLEESNSTESEYSDSEYEESDSICGKCGGLFNEGELWIGCDDCTTWFHVTCTNLNKKTKTQIDAIESWNCQVCCKRKAICKIKSL